MNSIRCERREKKIGNNIARVLIFFLLFNRRRRRRRIINILKYITLSLEILWVFSSFKFGRKEIFIKNIMQSMCRFRSHFFFHYRKGFRKRKIKTKGTQKSRKEKISSNANMRLNANDGEKQIK